MLIIIIHSTYNNDNDNNIISLCPMVMITRAFYISLRMKKERKKLPVPKLLQGCVGTNFPP